MTSEEIGVNIRKMHGRIEDAKVRNIGAEKRWSRIFPDVSLRIIGDFIFRLFRGMLKTIAEIENTTFVIILSVFVYKWLFVYDSEVKIWVVIFGEKEELLTRSLSTFVYLSSTTLRSLRQRKAGAQEVQRFKRPILYFLHENSRSAYFLLLDEEKKNQSESCKQGRSDPCANAGYLGSYVGAGTFMLWNFLLKTLHAK